ncbi:MAG: MFS transporter [Eggerthellaceae bacterium]|nr:MFS transporter [Eggerthellaceae bacterium]
MEKVVSAIKATPLSRKTWFLIVILAFFGQVAWAVENNFFNLFIQDTFGASLNDVALMVSASAFVATATTLFVGAWSDRVGKRKVFIAVGSVLWALSIGCFCILQTVSEALTRDAVAAAALGITLTIIFDCIMTFFGSMANDSCFNAWMTDITDSTNRGRVEGVNSAMPLLSMLLVFGGAMFLMVVGEDGTVTYDYPLFFAIIGGLVLVVGILSFALMEDSKPQPNKSGHYLANVFYGFRPSVIKENKLLYLVLAGFCVFAIGMQVIMPYYVLYLRLPYILGENYVFVMAPCIIIAAIFTIFYGRGMDKRGFVKSIIIPLLLFIVGCVVLTVLTDMIGVFIGSMLMLSGYLGAAACFGAEIRNNTPLKNVGMLQGVRICMIVLIPMLIGPWIGSSVSASSGMIGFGVVGDGFTPSSLIFLGGAAVACLTFIVWLFIRKQPVSKDPEHKE